MKNENKVTDCTINIWKICYLHFQNRIILPCVQKIIKGLGITTEDSNEKTTAISSSNLDRA